MATKAAWPLADTREWVIGQLDAMLKHWGDEGIGIGDECDLCPEYPSRSNRHMYTDHQTACAESLERGGYMLVARFHTNDEAIRYRRRVARGRLTHIIHNCPQDHGHTEGAWTVWRAK